MDRVLFGERVGFLSPGAAAFGPPFPRALTQVVTALQLVFQQFRCSHGNQQGECLVQLRFNSCILPADHRTQTIYSYYIRPFPTRVTITSALYFSLLDAGRPNDGRPITIKSGLILRIKHTATTLGLIIFPN